MALIDKASLMMVPSLVEDGTLYNVLPTGNFAADKTDNNNGYDSTRADFTFSRNADIEATRVNSSGLIEKAKVNLALQSNTFSDGVWPLENTTITGGQSGYDGTSDAWLLNSSASGGNIRQGYSTTGVVTFSVYAKKGTNDGIRIRFDQTTDSNVYIDLTDGSDASTSSNVISHSATSVGGGWYRVSMTFVSSGPVLFRIYPTDDAGNAVAGNILIQDAQLNHGLIAQDYVETTTTAVVEGLTADLPRLDYSGGASCPSLLLEPSRSNQITQSEYFGGWAANATITANAGISPEGVQNAYNIAANSGAGNGILKINSVLSSTQYVCSLYVKSAGATTGSLRLFDGSTGGSTTTTFTPTSEWQRVEVTRTSGASTFQFRVDIHSNDGDLLIYGAQLEAGSYPTSYIPTYGTAANRGRDTSVITGASDLIGQTEGTLYWEGSMIEEVNNDVFYIGGSTDGIAITKIFTTSDRFRFYIRQNGAQTLLTSGAISNVGDNVKVAIAYKSGDIVAYVNGVQQASSSISLSFSASISSVLLANSAFWLNYATKECKQALLFKTRLTNAELAALTTI